MPADKPTEAYGVYAEDVLANNNQLPANGHMTWGRTTIQRHGPQQDITTPTMSIIPRHYVFRLQTDIYLTIDPIWGTSEIFELEQQKHNNRNIQSIQFNFHHCCQRYAKYSNQLSASTPRNKNTQTY